MKYMYVCVARTHIIHVYTCAHIIHVRTYMYTHSKKNVKVLLFATDFNKMHAYVRPRETSKLSGFEDGRGGQSPGMRRRGDRTPSTSHY